MKTLQELSLLAGTDKGNGHSYIPFYESLLESKRDSVKKVLEIGVGNTPEHLSSLYMWRQYFPHAEIFGADNDLNKLIQEDGIHIYYCDGNDEDSLKTLTDIIGGDFDLIVEDASHDLDCQITCAKALVPFLAPGGTYVMEDVDKAELIKKKLAGFTCEYFEFNGPGDALMTVKQI